MNAVPQTINPLPGSNKPPTALIVDDLPSERMLLESCIAAEGMEVIHAENGEEALAICAQQPPDIILMDVHMPKMDGIEAAKKLRQQFGDLYVPIIFLNELDSTRQLLACMQAGGDDFIVKPFNPIILSIKVQSYMRIKGIHQAQQALNQELQEHQASAEIEQEFASSLNKKIVESGFVASPNVKYDLSPMAMFNGDMLLCAYTPANKMQVLLGDFTGHGISASVAAAPASEIFYGMTNKGFGIVEIAEEINKKLVRLLPSNMFLAATILCLDQENSNLSLITCGLPDHFLFSRAEHSIQTIQSTNLPLGILPHIDLAGKALQFKIDSDDHLIMFSDGVIESENINGKPFDFEGVRSSLSSDQPCLESVLEALSKHRGNLAQQDDITLVEVICDLDPKKWERQENPSALETLPSSQWKQSCTFYADTLKRFNPVPVVVNALMEIQGLHPFRESIFLVVTELFVNALEHGLLKLDSKLKTSPEGFGQYFEIRNERLESLDEGAIEFQFEHQPTPTGGTLSISVIDTGTGFDEPSKPANDEADLNQYHGRGLRLIRQICESLEYSDGGRRAKALFAWNQSIT